MYVPAEEKYITEGLKLYEFRGVSTEDKPVGGDIATGSAFFEVDTKKVCFYNSEASSGEEWGAD